MVATNPSITQSCSNMELPTKLHKVFTNVGQIPKSYEEPLVPVPKNL